MPRMPYVRQGMFSPTQLVLLIMMTCVPSNQVRLDINVSRKPTDAFSSSPASSQMETTQTASVSGDLQ
eukprot:1133494-Pelagomonas_calceolata.AAC.5